MNLMMAIMPTTLLGVLPVGLLLVQNGSISPAELAMGIILSLSIVGPLMKATTFINEAKSMEYAVEAANELLNLPVLPDSGKIVSIPHNDIALKHVTFSYDGSEQNEVLHDVNLELPEGSFTALVGPSGGGKSTIARLIARFWDVTGGSITIGGKNIKELSIRQLSELVSFVTQDNFLFNCSLKENIRLGNPNATDEEVYAAAKAACCDEFIVRLDKGLLKALRSTPRWSASCWRSKGSVNRRLPFCRASIEKYAVIRPRIVLGAVYRLRCASPRFLRAAMRKRFCVSFQRHGSQPHCKSCPVSKNSASPFSAATTLTRSGSSGRQA